MPRVHKIRSKFTNHVTFAESASFGEVGGVCLLKGHLSIKFLPEQVQRETGSTMATGIQGFVNKVKSTAREFADSLTPVLQVM